MDEILKLEPDLCDVPSEREFASSMIMTSLIVLALALIIAFSVTWFTTKGYEPHIHNQALRTSIILPLLIVPVCTSVIAVQSYRNHRRMLAVAELARTDEMTGLANRRAFMHAASSTLEETDLNYAGLSMFIVDLDHFKQVNDVYGHETGDEVLIHAANQIERAAASHSIVARLGGEEFAVLVSYRTIAELHQRAEAIRHQVASSPCQHQDHSINVSASIGISIVHPRDTVSSALSRADDALYEAKDQGRNRFVVAA